MLSNRGDTERGFTLLEVLFALVISGIFCAIALRFLTDQWQGASTLKSHLEAHYAVMTAGKTVTDEIRKAQTVEWVRDPGVLKVLPMPIELPSVDAPPLPSLDKDIDKYFIDDADHDGTKDLYWKHLGISEPVASFMTRWECTEVEPGLWNVFLEACVDGQIARWRSVIRQRVYSRLSSVSTGQRVMLACSSLFF